MSKISIVDKIWSLSIEFNTNQSTNIRSRFKSWYLKQFHVIIDLFDFDGRGQEVQFPRTLTWISWPIEKHVWIFVDKIDNQLKILWSSTFIDKLGLSIENYRQISSTIDLSTTFSMINFDRHVMSRKKLPFFYVRALIMHKNRCSDDAQCNTGQWPLWYQSILIGWFLLIMLIWGAYHLNKTSVSRPPFSTAAQLI